MKILKEYGVLLLWLFWGITACDNNDNTSLYPEYYDTIQELVQKGDLLKIVTQNDNCYIFTFESKIIEIPTDIIQNVHIDDVAWRTTITFVNGSTYIVPSIGDAIDDLIVKIVVNPSGYNPLAANLYCELPAQGRIKIIVHSKPDAKTPDVEFQSDDVQRSQVIQILGLYPNYENKVTLVYLDKTGKERAKTTIQIKTKALNVTYLPAAIRIIKRKINEMEPGMTLISSPGKEETDTSIPYMIDADGEIRWILDWNSHPELKYIGAQCGLKRMKNGNYIAGDCNHGLLVEVDALGNIVHKWDLKGMGYNFHHEAVETKNGKIQILVTKAKAMLADGSNSRIFDHTIELDPITGSITKEWDYAQILDSARINKVDMGEEWNNNMYLGANRSNWLHNNGIFVDDDEMVATGRWLGFFKYDYSGKLKYIMAPHNNWREQYKRYLLTPLDRNGQPITDIEVLNGEKVHEDFEWCWGPHCPIVLPNGHVMVFDNGYNRYYSARSEEYSRAVEYEIDEKNMTVRQVWQYGKERGRECYAMAVSSVQYLEQTGNRLFCPGIGNILSDGSMGARIIEINPKTQEIILEMELPGVANTIFHRANRIPLYPEG